MKKTVTFLLSMTLVLVGTIPAFADDTLYPNPGATCNHYWTEWGTSVEPTINREGAMSRQCSLCGINENTTIDKLVPFAKLAKKKYKVRVGKSIKLRVQYAEGDSVKKWKSANKKVATVNKKGKVVGKKSGTAKIVVTLKSGKKASCKVKVTKGNGATLAAKASTGGTVYWTPSGSVYHKSRNCPTLSRSRTIYSGTVGSCGKNRACKVCG